MEGGGRRAAAPPRHTFPSTVLAAMHTVAAAAALRAAYAHTPWRAYERTARMGGPGKTLDPPPFRTKAPPTAAASLEAAQSSASNQQSEHGQKTHPCCHFTLFLCQKMKTPNQSAVLHGPVQQISRALA